MSRNLNSFKSVISDYAEHISGAKIKELQAEDPLSKNLLRQRLCEVNSKRTVFFAVPAAVISVIFAVVTVVNTEENDLLKTIFSLAGLLLTAVGCGCAAMAVYREYEKENPI